MKDKILFSVALLFALLAGFFLGVSQSPSPALEATSLDSDFVEMSLVQLERIEGDSLFLSLSGPVRVLWSDNEHLLEFDGDYTIPLGQIPNENDLELRSFPYVGNAKTRKFYPSDSYPARGTAIKDRRFFIYKEAALSEGFITMKGMD